MISIVAIVNRGFVPAVQLRALASLLFEDNRIDADGVSEQVRGEGRKYGKWTFNLVSDLKGPRHHCLCSGIGVHRVAGCRLCGMQWGIPLISV